MKSNPMESAMKLSRNMIFALLAAGCTAAMTMAPANAAPFGGMKAPIETADKGGDVVHIAQRSGGGAARSAPRAAPSRAASRPTPQRSVSRAQPQRQQAQRQVQKQQPQRQVQKQQPQKQQAQKQQPQKQLAQKQQPQKQQAQKQQPQKQLAQKQQPQKQQAQKQQPQKQQALKQQPQKQQAGKTQQASLAGKSSTASQNKPTSYQSNLKSTFNSKHKQSPALGKGRSILPNMKHNSYMLAGAKGYKSGYKPYWFSYGGSTWYRYYYTAVVGGVAYWYWNNLTTQEVYENRATLTSYTGGDCGCEEPPPAPPACDCDDDDCGE
jgi:outer membrane biosynthesis protein TonB